MQLVFVYGPPAAGKYTVSKLLAEQTGYALFHNHLVVDTVHAVFPFGSPSFVRLREQFWMDVLDAACAEDRSLIFTFQPEGSVSTGFAQSVIDRVRSKGGNVLLVYLTLSGDGQVARIANDDRARFGKLRNKELLQVLQADFSACEAAMPEPDLVIDTGKVSAEAAAEQIVSKLGGR